MQNLLTSFSRLNFIGLISLFLICSNVMYGASIQLDNLNHEQQTVDLLYDFEGDVAGFQFNITGLSMLDSATGGAVADNGFSVSVGSSTVLGFSFTKLPTSFSNAIVSAPVVVAVSNSNSNDSIVVFSTW